MPKRPGSESSPWIAAAAIFALALTCRLSLPYRPHDEGDERIYQALVQQLDAGGGYTLQGHAILDESGTDRVQYGQKLFFHPPAGIALFWTFHRLAGERGFLAVQLVSFAIFFWSILLLSALVVRPFGVFEAALAAALAGFAPIMIHVTARYWLDGPVLAFSTLAATLYLLSVRRDSVRWALAAGVAMGFASLVKPTAFLIVPGLALLAAAVATDRNDRGRLTRGAIFLGTAAACYSVWLIWRWSVMGSPFPGWAGRPTQSLATVNAFVRYVTVVRAPWVYLRLLPEVLPTLIPSLLLVAAQWHRVELRQRSLALTGWIAVIVAVHVALGYLGFSKVLRYVILVSPATILLFVMQTGAAWREARSRSGVPGRFRWALLGIAAAGLVLEVGQGMNTMVVDRDLIVPWLWGL
jgi:4-amino-4-deoxy-L-arabinose transferase-like glycosyltransferase